MSAFIENSFGWCEYYTVVQPEPHYPHGRRNLSPDAFKMLLGRRYNRAKKANGQRGPEKLDQIDPAYSTAAKLAKEHAVSEPTVKRAARAAIQEVFSHE